MVPQVSLSGSWSHLQRQRQSVDLLIGTTGTSIRSSLIKGGPFYPVNHTNTTSGSGAGSSVGRQPSLLTMCLLPHCTIPIQPLRSHNLPVTAKVQKWDESSCLITVRFLCMASIVSCFQLCYWKIWLCVKLE